jgi:NADPH-dependent 2,4-dienoyl-CoA reductase/sulfur reductase-like enzyme
VGHFEPEIEQGADSFRRPLFRKVKAGEYMMMSKGLKPCRYLIIGGGMTADAAVKGIREIDEKGKIIILTEEPDPPYQRPPLTKSLWTKGKSIDDIWCGTEDKGAEVLRKTRAISLNTGKREVTDDHGGIYRYEKLLLATGGTPKRLPFGEDHILYYRTCADYRRLRSMTEQGDRFAVFGAGFIGSEIAAALAINGKKVTMIFPEAGIAARLLPPEFSRAVTKYYEEKGVKVLAGHKPVGIDGNCVVRLGNGQTLSADGIIAGLGIVPNTQLAEDAGLDVKNGILVDENLRTKDPLVFAAGDVANFYNPQLNKRLRVEHEDNALIMGEVAGHNMAGVEQPYHHLPYFYSDLFDAGYEAVGETDPSLQVITELRHPEEKGAFFYLKESRVRGVVFWNIFGKVEDGRELIARQESYTAGSLKAWAGERLAT